MSRFGGHETFCVREGWLPKALGLLKSKTDLFKNPLACDHLGVGRNMAKSIDHWLRATCLVKKESRDSNPTITDLGKLILKKDPYFLRSGTWWALHVNIASSNKHAVAWSWLFNRAYFDRFDRYRFASDLNRHLTISGERLPSPITLKNDISCVLSSYSISVPPKELDPEEVQSCPFQSLALITHLRETDTYQINRKYKNIPSELLGYSLAKFANGTEKGKQITMSLAHAYASDGGPGKALSLDMEAFIETFQQAEDDLGSNAIHVELSGAERTVRFRQQKPVKWMEQYYKGLAK